MCHTATVSVLKGVRQLMQLDTPLSSHDIEQNESQYLSESTALPEHPRSAKFGFSWVSVLGLGVMPGISAATLMDAAYVVLDGHSIKTRSKPLFPNSPTAMRIAFATSHGLICAFTTGLILDRLMCLSQQAHQGSSLSSSGFSSKVLRDRSTQRQTTPQERS